MSRCCRWSLSGGKKKKLNNRKTVALPPRRRVSNFATAKRPSTDSFPFQTKHRGNDTSKCCHFRWGRFAVSAHIFVGNFRHSSLNQSDAMSSLPFLLGETKHLSNIGPLGHGSSTVFTTCEERCRNSAYLPQILEEALKLVFKSMSVAKPPGHDRICLSDIVGNFEKLKHLLLKIVNSSLSD